MAVVVFLKKYLVIKTQRATLNVLRIKIAIKIYPHPNILVPDNSLQQIHLPTRFQNIEGKAVPQIEAVELLHVGVLLL